MFSFLLYIQQRIARQPMRSLSRLPRRGSRLGKGLLSTDNTWGKAMTESSTLLNFRAINYVNASDIGGNNSVEVVLGPEEKSRQGMYLRFDRISPLDY
mmetsp:Transcript_27219/g.42290  ORF Transcript_27219/g.42290 Transcript_27219/m.42290 type:complete len:98 (-) Transcript_27219:329-622(-)